MTAKPYRALLGCAAALALIASGAAADDAGRKELKKPNSNNLVCTQQYAPVCGQVKGQGQPQTFSNTCVMNAEKAELISTGECLAKRAQDPRR